MLILKNNYKPESPQRRITCHACGSELLINDNDICGIDKPFIICAACHNHIFIEPEQKPVIECEYCHEMIESEPYIGWNGAEWAKCPKCGEETFVSEGIDLTGDNLVYPTHFRQMQETAAKIGDSQIQKWMQESVKHLDKDCDFWYVAGGDTIVLAFKTDADFSEATVYVCKNYEECDIKIPKENF